MTEFEIEFIDENHAVEVERILNQSGKSKNRLEIFHGKCLVAVNWYGEVVAFAEHFGEKSVAYQVELFFFARMGMRMKKRIKVTFLEMLFSKEFKKWNKIPREFKLQAGEKFMLPGG